MHSSSNARDYALARRGKLRFAATLTIGSYVVPALLAHFAREHPDVSASVAIENTQAVARAVREGDVPLGLVEGIVRDDALESVAFARDRLLLAVPARDHPFSQRSGGVRPEELRGLAFVSREVGSGTRDLGYDLLQRRGIDTTIAAELPSGEAILRAVESGLGVAILSERIVERAALTGDVRALALLELDVERDFSLLTVRGRTLSPLAQAFAQLVTQGIDS